MITQYFNLNKEGSTVKRESLAGLTSFLAAMYIVIVNPTILAEAGISFSAALTATVLISFFGSLAMGFYARNPIVIAPGMGLNALFSFTLVLGAKIPVEIALGCVFWSGVIFVLLALFNVRAYVLRAIPASLRYAVACGIGLFIALLGLINAKLIISNPATVVSLGPINAELVTFLVGLAVTIWLVVRRVPAALIIGIVLTTCFAYPIGRWWGDGSVYNHLPTLVNFQGIFAWPDFTGIGKIDLIHAAHIIYWPFIFVILFTSFFDAFSTFVGVCEAGKLLDINGEPRNFRRSMLVDGLIALVSGPLGSSPGNAFVESAAGISQGGRTGLVAVVAGLLFLPFLFISPLLSLIPAIATAPALVIVGVFMLAPIRAINWQQMDEAIPAFMALLLIPLTYSITHGIIFSFLAFVVCKMAAGKHHEIHLTMWILALLSLLLLAD